MFAMEPTWQKTWPISWAEIMAGRPLTPIQPAIFIEKNQLQVVQLSPFGWAASSLTPRCDGIVLYGNNTVPSHVTTVQYRYLPRNGVRKLRRRPPTLRKKVWSHYYYAQRNSNYKFGRQNNWISISNTNLATQGYCWAFKLRTYFDTWASVSEAFAYK